MVAGALLPSTKRHRRFPFLVFVASVAAASLYPISALFHLQIGASASLRNELAFTIYLPFLFPLAVAVFFTSVDFSFLRSTRRAVRRLLLVILAVLAVLVVIAAIDDSRRPLSFAPYMLHDSKAAAAMQVRLRSALYSPHDSDFRTNENGSELARKEVSEYQEAFPPFQSFTDQAQRGTSTSWIALILNILAFEFAVLYLWYLGCLVLLRVKPRATTVNDLVLIFGLLVLWLPVRLYSEWYANFYVVDLTNFGAYIVSILAAVISVFLLVGLVRPDAATRIFSLGITVLVTVVGALARLEPEWLWDVGNAVEHLDSVFFVLSAAVALFAIVIFVVLIVQGSLDAGEALIDIGRRSEDGRE